MATHVNKFYGIKIFHTSQRYFQNRIILQSAFSVPTTTLKKIQGDGKNRKKGSVAFGTETLPNPTLLKIPVHDMDIFIMAKKSPRLIDPYCDQCGVKGI